ncbi:hypothetical protein V6N13_146963 [Hibiscus sabdariffa]
MAKVFFANNGSGANDTQVADAVFRKWHLKVHEESTLLYETCDKHSTTEGSRKLEHSDELKCLDKAAIVSDAETKGGDFSSPWRLCTVTQVEELKILLRKFPVSATIIVFVVVYAQMSTMLVEQGMMMDSKIGSFTIPPVSLSTFAAHGNWSFYFMFMHVSCCYGGERDCSS